MTIGAKLQEYLNARYTNLDVNISDIRIEEPPTDDSHTTRMELEELEQIIQEAKLPREIMRVADRDPLRLFYSVAKKKGLDPLEEEAKEWADDWTKLSFEFKLKFKRRRPWEVKKEHDIDFVVNKSDTTESPSYPSGHAMMGYGVAEFYKDKYPLMADEWDNVAEIIAHSRLQMGVHYPSDVEASKKIVGQLAEQVKEASFGRFARAGMKRTLQSGKGVKVTTQGGGKKVIGNTNRRYTMKKTTTPPASQEPATQAPASTWGQTVKDWGSNIGTWAGNNPMQATAAGGATAYGGFAGFNKLRQPKPINSMPKVGSLDRVKPRTYEDLSKQASLPSLNKILKATESGLIKLRLPELADKVDLYRARRNLGQAVKDLHKYESVTGRFGQMPRIVIPKSHLDIPDLYRLGFQDSLIAVPEIGQKTWTTYRHPLDRLHLHDHGKYLNMHIDSLPSLQMIAERNSLSAKARRKLMETIPEGVKAWRPGKSKDRGFLKKLDDQVSGLGHAILEGGPGYINYALKQLNPWKVSMAEEVISKLPKDYLKKRYGIVKTSAEKLRLYHGSPHDLETLEPRQPNKGTWGEHGLYGTPNQLVAALYAIARNDSKGSWGVLPDGRLIAKSKKQLNPEGYVYEYDSDDYIPPPEDDPGIGYASQSSPEVLSKEKVYLDNLRDRITRVDDRDKFLEYFKKTSSEQPLYRHRSTLLIRDPETGKLLAAKEPEGSLASPFYFPGGGLYDDEYDTPRNPSNEDIIEGARREALEELGIQLDNPRVVGSYAQEMEDWWKEKTLKNRGVPYLGGHEHYVLADKGKEDRSLYNVEGDAFEQGDYYDPKEIVEALSRAAKGDSTFAPFNREQVRAIKDNLLKKNASDLSVLTAVPTQNLDLIMRKGLYSQKAMLDDPEVMAAFLAQRNADKAWKNDEQYNEKRFREQYNKRRELATKPEALEGPSVFYTEPDPDKVSDPRHFINKFNTQTLRVNLSKLLNDIPETRVHGAELEPFNEEAYEADPDNYWMRRHRDLTPEEVAKYIATDPKELWKHYKDEYLGRYYAADVPHAHIVTPSGIIPPEYLEQVEKTSSAKEQPLLRHRATLLIRDPETGKILAANNRDDSRFDGISPYFFPGGGLYADEYSTPRTPTEEEIIEGARREALEELGIALDNAKVVGSTELLMPEYKEKALSFRGAPYIGKHEHYVLADKGKEDSSLYNVEGDAFTKGDYYDPQTLYESLERYGRGDNSHAPLNAGQAKAIKEHLLYKTSSAKEQLKHILVTGHSGAGKTTYARQLAEELGMPLHELDSRAKEILSQDYPDHEGIGWPGDLSERVVREALSLDTPHVIEGTQIHDVPDLGADLRRILVDTPVDRVVEQRAAREYEKRKLKNKSYRPMEGHRDAARKLVDYYRESIDNFRGLPGVESIVPEVKQAALEDEFQPDLTPDDLKALGVYDQVYGDAPSEASMKEWPEHWINPQDPLGWLQWYDRYSEGRRTDDDERQMKRWKSFKARHLAQYLKKPTPRRAAALRNWGIDVEKY